MTLRSVEALSRMRLRYFKRYPWVNRFTCRRRGAAFAEIRKPRPLLTNLHVARIMGTVWRNRTDEEQIRG